MPARTSAFTDAQRTFLTAPQRFGTIATINPDGTPHQTVIWYLVRDDGLVVNSLVGRRWPTNLLRDPRFSICAEAGLDYIVVRGEAERHGDAASAQEDIAAMARRYEVPEDAEDMIANTFSLQERISYLLRPRSVTVHGDEFD